MDLCVLSDWTRATNVMDAIDGLPLPQRYWAILTIAIAVAMAVLDSAIANIALPTISRDLGASPAASIWVVNAYQLTLTISLLPFSSLGDIFGYRRVYWSGLVLFTLASLACAMSHSLMSLTAARVLQGFGAAGITSVNTALVRFIYPRKLLGRGMGINALVVATASAAGPTIAAGILSVASWQWLFMVNVPLGALALGLSINSLPRTEHPRQQFDFGSALLSAGAFGLLVTAIAGLGHGESALLITTEFATAALLGTTLVRRQSMLSAPMLPIDLFRRPVFSLSAATSVCSFAAQGLAFVALPFYFQDVLNRSQVETGLLITPWPLAVAAIAPFAGRLADRYPAGILGGLGLAILSGGLLLVALLPAHPAAGDIIWRMALCGFGFGLFQSPNNRAIMSSVPRMRSGNASGVISSARLLGQTTGAALVALVFGLTAARGGVGPGTLIAVVLAACFAAAAAVASGLRLVDFGDGDPAVGRAGERGVPGD